MLFMGLLAPINILLDWIHPRGLYWGNRKQENMRETGDSTFLAMLKLASRLEEGLDFIMLTSCFLNVKSS